MNFFRRLFAGRYGSDQLSLFLVLFGLVLSIVLQIIGSIFGIQFISLLSWIPLGIAIYRMFSKKIEVRSMENYKFMMKVSPIYKKWLKFCERKRDNTHRYYKCPKCKATLRVPKGRGKICITCPKCHIEFVKKT